MGRRMNLFLPICFMASFHGKHKSLNTDKQVAGKELKFSVDTEINIKYMSKHC